MTLKTRLKRLEAGQPTPDRPIWAELLDGGRVVLQMQNGERIETTANEIPPRTKVYVNVSPTVWSEK